MGIVETLIFNALAGRHTALLPGVGCLWVERVPATAKGNRLTPPRNAVRFGTREREEAESVVAMLAGAGVQEPEKAYESWQEALPSERTFAIEGVGELRAGHFTPSAELDALLNPSAAVKPMKLRRRKRRTWPWVVLPVVLLLAGGAWFVLMCEEGREWKECLVSRFCVNTGRNGADDKAVQPVENNVHPVDEAAAVAVDSLPVADTGADSAVASTSEEPAATTTAATAGEGGVRYVVVGGVFSVMANADKYVAQMRRKYPDLAYEYEKIPYKGGTIMVALSISSDMERAQAEMRTISRATSNRDMWIYKWERK